MIFAKIPLSAIAEVVKVYTPGVLLATFAPSILTPSILTSAVSLLVC